MEVYLCPAWLSNWFEARGLKDPRKRLHAGYLFSNLLLLAVLPMLHWLPHFCLLRTVTGIPCPGCGVTHALLLVAAFKLHGSLASNPAGIFVASTIGFQLIARPWAILHENAYDFVTNTSRWLGAIAVFALFAVWTFKLLKLAV